MPGLQLAGMSHHAQSEVTVLREMAPRAGLLGDIEVWSDARFGIVTGFEQVEVVGLGWQVVLLRLARPTFGRASWLTSDLTGSGCSLDEAEAWRRASGEAMERYAAIDHDYRDELRWLPAMHPESLLRDFPACREDEPCPRAFTAQRGRGLIGHCQAGRLGDGAMVWLPASFVHLNYRPESPEVAVTMPISTGLAYHTELHSAVWNGLCEVVERDALMLTWLARRTVPRVAVPRASTPPALTERLDRLASANLRAYLLDMTTDVSVTAVLAVLLSEQPPYAVVGASAGGDPASACVKALDEAVSVRWSLGRRPQVSPPAGNDFGWVRSLADHARLYAALPGTDPFDFLIDGIGGTVGLDELSARPRLHPPSDWVGIEMLGRDLAERGLPVYWLELAAPTVSFVGHVVKVVVPGLVPLSQAHAARWLATPRALEALAGQAPNPHPHPFA